MSNQDVKYPHYFKSVSHLEAIDVYRVLSLFQVNEPCIQHAIKKLLCAGDRGNKSMITDITEARDSLNRHLEMLQEDGVL